MFDFFQEIGAEECISTHKSEFKSKLPFASKLLPVSYLCIRNETNVTSAIKEFPFEMKQNKKSFTQNHRANVIVGYFVKL